MKTTYPRVIWAAQIERYGFLKQTTGKKKDIIVWVSYECGRSCGQSEYDQNITQNSLRTNKMKKQFVDMTERLYKDSCFNKTLAYISVKLTS